MNTPGGASNAMSGGSVSSEGAPVVQDTSPQEQTSGNSNKAANMQVPKDKALKIVIKLGTSSIVNEKTHEPLLSILSQIVETAVKLRKDGHKVIIVSSGAIGVGLRRMDMEKRPKFLPQVQALAAIGQSRLIGLWDSLFAHLQQPIGQVLLTRIDIQDRTQYKNACNTFEELLNMGAIPIVNENDTVAVSEIKFGDNDTLSAITAAMVHADYLFLMTDVDCLYDKNPRQHKDAVPHIVVDNISNIDPDVSSAGSSLGTGGMSTKITAARLAVSAGVTTIITRSSLPDNIPKIVTFLECLKQIGVVETAIDPASTFTNEQKTEAVMIREQLLKKFQTLEPLPLHTRFTASVNPIRDRYFWLMNGLKPHGTVFIDSGAYNALIGKAGLLPVGVLGVDDIFQQQEAVRLVVVDRGFYMSYNGKDDQTTKARGVGMDVGRALVNYSAVEISRIAGCKSTDIQKILGYADSEYVALRESISLYIDPKYPRKPPPPPPEPRIELVGPQTDEVIQQRLDMRNCERMPVRDRR